MTNYDGTRLCGVDDLLGVGQQCKWPHLDVTWTVVADIPNFAKPALKAVVDKAWSGIISKCGIRPQFTENPQANIVIGTQSIGPGGVLADMQLPCGNISPNASLRMRIDDREAWTDSINPRNDQVDITRVIRHELGHAGGIPHIGTGNLMAPVYSIHIRELQSGDIAEWVSRYGLPNQPPPPVDPPPTDYEEILAYLLKDNQIYIRSHGIVRKL